MVVVRGLSILTEGTQYQSLILVHIISALRPFPFSISLLYQRPYIRETMNSALTL